MKIEINVPDEYQKKYDEAIAKLKRDKDNMLEAEKDALEIDVARIVALEQLEHEMREIAEGQNPFDFFDAYDNSFYSEIDKRVR